MLLDDAVRRRQAQARALPHVFRGEERLEEVRCDLGGDAGARVAHRQQDIVAGRQVRVRSNDVVHRSVTLAVSTVSWPPVGMASRAFATRLSSTCSIWPRSALTRPRSGARTLDALDVLVDRRVQHALQVAHQLVEIERLGARIICRREKARSCWVSAVRRSDASRTCSMSARAESPRGQHLFGARGIADDDGEQIVELMRHAARQPPDRLHLLSDDDLALHALACGDVGHDGERPGVVPFLVGDRSGLPGSRRCVSRPGE